MLANLLRRRWSLYVRYKTYSVKDEDIRIDSSLTPTQNYNALFVIHKRIQKCLDARIEVHTLYADDDQGHKTAIEYTRDQLKAADRLLTTICQDLKTSLQDEIQTPSSSNKPADTSHRKVRRSKKKKRKATITPEDTLRALAEDEWSIVEQIHEQRIQSLHDVYRQIVEIVDKTDEAIVKPLREMIAANVNDPICHCYIFQCIVGIALKHMIQSAREASRRTFLLKCTSVDVLRRWNAASPPSPEDLRSAIIHMSQIEAIPKITLDDAIYNQLLVGNRYFAKTDILRLSNHIINHGFGIAGDYTTMGTATIVSSVIEAICVIAMIHYRWDNRAAMANANVTGFQKLRMKHGDTYIIRLRHAIEHLVRVLDPSVEGRVHICWEVLRRVPDSMVALDFAQMVFGGDKMLISVVPFVIHIR